MKARETYQCLRRAARTRNYEYMNGIVYPFRRAPLGELALVDSSIFTGLFQSFAFSATKSARESKHIMRNEKFLKTNPFLGAVHDSGGSSSGRLEVVVIVVVVVYSSCPLPTRGSILSLP